MSLTLSDIFQKLKIQLSSHSPELSAKHAEQIIEQVLHISRNKLYLNPKFPINRIQENTINDLTRKFISGIPLPYVLGSTYFYSKKFLVSQEVLIPRPDTESLVELVLKYENTDFCCFADIGTGSGNIAEVLCDLKPNWHSIAIDISEISIRIAKKNCSHHISLLCCDTLSAIKEGKIFDFIVSNPPYIAEKEMEELDESVLKYEPALALYGGKDGLNFYRNLAQDCKSYLKENGTLYCEIGATQHNAAVNIFKEAQWQNISIHYDLAKRPRVIKAQKPIETL